MTLACATSDAKIYYTLDGTEPSAEKTLYSTAISVQTAEASQTLKAIAIKEGMENSDVLSITYTNSAVQTQQASAKTKSTK